MYVLVSVNTCVVVMLRLSDILVGSELASLDRLAILDGRLSYCLAKTRDR